MHKVETKIDAASGLLTITKSGGASQHNFLKGDGISDEGGSMVNLGSPYRDSVWVKRAIKHVAEPISSVPINFTLDKKGGEVIIEDPILDFWDKPAVTSKKVKMNRGKFIFATVAWWKLAGQAFWIMDDSWLDSKIKDKAPLIVARPDKMTAIYENGNGELMGWRFIDGSGKAHNLIAEQVVHLADWNPDDEVNGLSEYTAAKVAAESDYSAGQFAKAIMDNNGDRGPFVIAKGGVPSDEQREQIERMLRQKRAMSRRGQFRAAFLTGDITVEDPGIQAVDSAFVAQRLENRHEIFIAFGVPASMADVVASYSIGSASDYYRLIEGTCKSMGVVITEGMEQVNEMLVGRPVFADLDWDEHSVMQEVRAERFESAAKGWDRGIPWTVLSDHLRLKLPKFAGDDVSRVPFSMKTVSEGERSKVKGQSADESTKVNALDELEDIFKNMPISSEPGSITKEKFEQDAADQELWEMLQSKRKPWENSFEKRFNRILMSVRAETLQNVRNLYAPAVQGKGESEKVKVSKDAVMKSSLSLTFDLGPWMDKISQGMGEITEQAVVEAGGQLVTDELELEEAVSLPTAAVESVVQNRQNMLSRTSTEIWHEIRELISEGIDAGDSIDELANRIRNKFNDISKARARRIAVTETAVAYEQGRYLTMQEAGITHKKWITASDDSVRDSHKQVNGEVIPIDEHFVVGNDALLHPADPKGSAEEVINCRCVSVADLGE